MSIQPFCACHLPKINIRDCKHYQPLRTTIQLLGSHWTHPSLTKTSSDLHTSTHPSIFPPLWHLNPVRAVLWTNVVAVGPRRRQWISLLSEVTLRINSCCSQVTKTRQSVNGWERKWQPGHDHCWAQCWFKCTVLRQKFTRTWYNNCMSGTCKVMYAYYKELPHGFVVCRCGGYGGLRHPGEWQGLWCNHGQRYTALAGQHGDPGNEPDHELPGYQAILLCCMDLLAILLSHAGLLPICQSHMDSEVDLSSVNEGLELPHILPYLAPELAALQHRLIAPEDPDWWDKSQVWEVAGHCYFWVRRGAMSLSALEQNGSLSPLQELNDGSLSLSPPPLKTCSLGCAGAAWTSLPCPVSLHSFCVWCKVGD